MGKGSFASYYNIIIFFLLSTYNTENPYTANTENYPLVYFPDFVEKVHTALPPPPSPPPMPKKPVVLQVSKKWITYPIWGALLLVFINILLGYKFFGFLPAALILVLTPIFSIFVLYPYVKKLYTQTYQNEVQAYEAALSEHTLELQQHKLHLETYLTEAGIRSYRQSLMAHRFLMEALPPKRVRRSVRVGRSEETFHKQLLKHFGKDFIRKSVQLGEGEFAYVPDCCYIDEEKGIYIDIEIDEPYVAETLEPIHYKGKDEARNAFFTKHGWLVIRFSEEQIIKFPQGCCNQIEALCRFALYQENKLELFVPQTEHWTKAKAIAMAQRGSRNY